MSSTSTSPDEPVASDGRRELLALAGWATGIAVAGGVTVARRIGSTANLGRTTPVLARRALPSTGSTVASTTQPAPASAPAATAPVAVPAASGVDLPLLFARRATFGPTPALLEEIRAVGVDAWLIDQLHPQGIDDAAVDRDLARLPDLDRSALELRQLGLRGEEAVEDLRTAAVLRAVKSRRQLLEVMVDLWHDRLAVSVDKGLVGLFLPTYDREVIRPHALGRFTELLTAATTSGAMLDYLDTRMSVAPDINENHARELLELHSVGRESGYGEADVTGAARVLSGWGIDDDWNVRFEPSRHHSGPAAVLGWQTPGRSGPAAARDLPSLLQHLAAHPATARRVASAIATRFVADAPPAALVDRLAATYLASGTDISAVLRELFASDELRTASPALVRRPFDLLAALLRGSDAELEIPNSTQRVVPAVAVAEQLPLVAPLVAPLADDIEQALDVADVVDPIMGTVTAPLTGSRPIARSIELILRLHGQPLFAASSPAGHSLLGARWSSGDALLRRWQLAELLAKGALPGFSVDPAPLLGGATTAGAAVDALARSSTGRTLSPASRAAVLDGVALGEGDLITDDAPRALLALVLAAPEAQVR